MGLATKVSYAAVADMERRIEQYFAARANEPKMRPINLMWQP